jgi:organic radical activating enzyme
MTKMIKFTDGFFCPAPWKEMYYHVDTASPCHNIRETKLSPSEYLKSDWLRNLKQDFVDGKVPSACEICKKRENLGLKSTRGQMFKFTPEIDRDEFQVEKETRINRLEIRSSNLCNFKCRMCEPTSSSEIAKEQNISDVEFSSDLTTEELKKISLDSVKLLCFTGGEPLLIKQYYEFMDLLIEQKLNDQIAIELFTNCSVYNPLFIDKLLKFKTIRFVMSIDGVGKTAEYIRHGTNWPVVEKNIYKFTEMFKNDQLFFNTAISSYVLLDVSSLAEFLMKLYAINDKIKTKCYTVVTPNSLHFLNLNADLRKKAIEEIDKAVEILNVENFDIFTKELRGIKQQLETAEFRNQFEFVKNTLILDKKRNESFETVFNYKLY